MTTAGATNSPFGWSSFAVMARDEAQRAGDLLRDQGIPVITRPADDEKSELLVPTASAELDRALEGMTGRSAPYGIADAFWDGARRTAADLQEMIRTGQLEDTIGNAAEALRDLLRPYI